jgi:pimeloyl-ACP methyl ester carboxylesterase
METIMSEAKPNESYSPGWYRSGTGDTCVVFVHGVRSTPDSAWRTKGKQGWPSVVAEDPRFQDFGILLVDYPTALTKHDYSFADAARRVRLFLQTERDEAGRTFDSYTKVIFVAHSAGGVVTRELLSENLPSLQNKQIGLLLVASPSTGSIYANFVSRIPGLTKHLQTNHLRQGNNWLSELDQRFRRVLSTSSNIIGLELIEDKSQKFSLGIFGLTVPKDSAARYFANATKIAGSDHSSIAKADSVNHESHRSLVALMSKFENQTTLAKTIQTTSADERTYEDLTKQLPDIVVDELRDNFWAGAIKYDRFQGLDNFERWAQRPSSLFLDPELQIAHQEHIQAVKDLQRRLSPLIFTHEAQPDRYGLNRDLKGIPGSLPHQDRYDEALQEAEDATRDWMVSYDAFRKLIKVKLGI